MVIIMNVKRIYVCHIYCNIKYDFLAPGIYRMYGNFVKNALVYHRRDGKYADLLSNEVYGTDLDGCFKEMFVNRGTLIPLCEVIDLNIKRENLSKKKILKLLREEAVKREGEVEKNEESI